MKTVFNFKFFKSILATLSVAVTIVMIYILFFYNPTFREITEGFWIEVTMMTYLSVQTKIFFTGLAEDAFNENKTVKAAKTDYDNRLDKNPIDVDDLDTCVKNLDIININTRIRKKIKNKTSKNCKNFKKKLEKIVKWSLILIRPIKSDEILSRQTEGLYITSKNYYRVKKILNIIFSTLVALIMSYLIAITDMGEYFADDALMARFYMYIGVIVFTISTTVIQIYNLGKKETIAHINRLNSILDRYESWKANGRKTYIRLDEELLKEEVS